MTEQHCRDCSPGRTLTLYVCPGCADRRTEHRDELITKTRQAISDGTVNGMKLSPRMAAAMERAASDLEARSKVAE